jgi:hypothetical protein
MRIFHLSNLGLLTFAVVFCVAGTSQADLITLQNPTATFSQTIFGGNPVSQAIDGNFGGGNGWAIHRGTEAEVNSGGGTDVSAISETAVFETVSDLVSLAVPT